MVAITSAARLADVSALHVAVLQPFSPLGITYALPANKVKVIGQKKAQDRNPAHLSPTLINFRIHRHLTKPIRRNTMSFDITALLEFYKQTKNMLEMSMHHIVNLHPMCGPCNSGLRNSNVTFIFA